MNGRICLSVEQAFDAGFAEPCEHLVPNPNDCSRCRLTDAEIGRLVVLLQGALRPQQQSTKTAA